MQKRLSDAGPYAAVMWSAYQ